MDFHFDNNKKIGSFEPIIGKEWLKQNIKNEHLNTIFNMIDDGDGKLSEEEYDLFQRLLHKADGINSDVKNSVTENSELKALIEQINDGEIDIDEMNEIPSEYLDRTLYSKEALEKRYPASEYEIKNPMSSQTTIINKKTGLRVMDIVLADPERQNDVTNITYYGEDGRESKFVLYDSKSDKIVAFVGADGVRHNILPEKLYGDVTAKKYGVINTTRKDFEKHLDELNKYNVEEIMAEYKDISGSSLISDIMTEWGLSSEKRAELSKKVIDVYIESRKRYIGNIEGFKEAFYELIDNERDGFTPMSSRKIEKLMKQLEDTQRNEVDKKVFEEINGVPNGKIDSDFQQGATGDCWFLAALKTIMSNPQTAKLLNDQISADKDGNVTVNLTHVGKSYKFTKDEILRENKLSSGDMDVRALELAIKQYLNEHPYNLNGIMHKIKMEDNNIEGGIPNYAYEILLGREGILNSTGYSEKMIFSESFVDDYISNGKYLVTVSSTNFLKGEESDFEVKDDKGFTHTLQRYHAYAVVGGDSKFVYLVNPWDTSSKLKVPRKEFADFFGNASVCSVDKIMRKIAEKYDFGENAIIGDDGRVIIHNYRKTIQKEQGDSIRTNKTTEPISKEEIRKIKEDAQRKYGKDYTVIVNSSGDIMLTPKNNE